MELVDTHNDSRFLWKLVLEETEQHVHFSTRMAAFIGMVCSETTAVTRKVIGPPQVILGGDISALTLRTLWDLGFMPTGIDSDFSKFSAPSWNTLFKEYHGTFSDIQTINVRAPAKENIDAARKALLELLHPHKTPNLKYIDFRPIASEELYTLCLERGIEVEKEPLLLEEPSASVHEQ